MNQLLNLLLVVVFVANLPSCRSQCDINIARRHACAGKCYKIAYRQTAEEIAEKAADQAGVIYETVLETYGVTYTV